MSYICLSLCRAMYAIEAIGAEKPMDATSFVSVETGRMSM